MFVRAADIQPKKLVWMLGFLVLYQGTTLVGP
jgi:hypothetical protein